MATASATPNTTRSGGNGNELLDLQAPETIKQESTQAEHSSGSDAATSTNEPTQGSGGDGLNEAITAERRSSNNPEKELRGLRQQLTRFSEINPEEYARLQEAERQKQRRSGADKQRQQRLAAEAGHGGGAPHQPVDLLATAGQLRDAGVWPVQRWRLRTGLASGPAEPGGDPMELMLFLLGSTMGCGVCGWWFGGLVAHDLGQQLRPPADFLPTEPPLAGSTVRRAERSPFVLPPPERSTPPAL